MERLNNIVRSLDFPNVGNITTYEGKLVTPQQYENAEGDVIGFSNNTESVVFSMQDNGEIIHCVASIENASILVHQVELKQIIEFKLENGSWQLTNYENLHRKVEINNMSQAGKLEQLLNKGANAQVEDNTEVNTNASDAAKAKLDAVKASMQNAGANKMDSFKAQEETATSNVETAKETQGEKINKLRGRISSYTQKMSPAFKLLIEFNREHGKCHGLITQKDASFRFKVRSMDKRDGKGERIVDVAAGKTKGGKDKYVKEYYLDLVSEKPGAIAGGVISMPKGGIKSSSQMLDPNLSVETSQKELKTLVLSSSALSYIISTLFAGEIREDEKTYGPLAGTLYSVEREGIAKVKDKEVYEPVTRYSLRADKTKRKSVPAPGAYFPRKVAKKIQIPQGRLTAEQAKELNWSAFITLFHMSPAADKAPYSRLKSEDAVKIKNEEKKDEEGKEILTSVYFKEGEEVQLSCIPYFAAKGDERKVPVTEIPLKEKKLTKTGKLRYRDVLVDSLDKELNGEETSFEMSEFQNFLDVVGRDNFNQEVLAKTLKGSKANQNQLSSVEVATATLLAATNKGVFGENKVIGVVQGAALDDLDKHLKDITNL